MIDFTSTQLISNIKTRAMIPTSQNLFTNQVIVDIITAELLSDIVPMIMNLKEEYFVSNNDQSIVSGTTSYDIPARAIGQKLRDVVLLNSDSKEIELARLNPDYLKKGVGFNSIRTIGNRTGFFFRDGAVILNPDTSYFTGYSLRMKYFRRPNNVILESKAGKITAINTTTKELTLKTVPSTWTAATTFDITKGNPGFKSLGDDLAISSIDYNNKIIILSSSVPTGTAVNDWVAEANFSPIPQIPYEVFPILEQRVVLKILEDLGDSEGLKNAADVYKDMINKFQILITPRADGSPKKFVRTSPIWGGNSSRYWWR